MNNRLGNVLAEVKAYVIITFGLLLYTLGWIVFLIPNNMVGGGVTGISAILLYAGLVRTARRDCGLSTQNPEVGNTGPEVVELRSRQRVIPLPYGMPSQHC